MGTVRGSRARNIWVYLGAAAAAVAMAVSCTPPPALVAIPDPPASAVKVESPDTVGPLRMRGSDLVDATGRIVLIHGMNYVRKEAPFVAPFEAGWLGPLDLEYLRNSGFNGIRLGVSYAALMPQPGQVDEAYLDQVVDTVDRLSEQGLWVQLDFHQDVFHMMPTWATPPDALELSDETPPLFSFIGWAGQYMSERSQREWDSFLEGEEIVGGRSVASVLGDAAAALAQRVADRDMVIGIELLNEPVAGSSIIRCIAEGCSDRDRLLVDRYAEIAAPIRAAAPEMPIWIEPFAPTGYTVGPEMPPLPVVPASDGAQVGLAWHLYCKDTDGGRPVESDVVIANLCQNRMTNGFAVGANQAKRLGAGTGVPVPRMLNEFGASNDPLDVTLVAPLADQQFVSWMYYHGARATSPYDSTMPDVVESQIIRPYPQATAGTPGALSFDPSSGRFSYRFTPDRSITAPTSVVVPARVYPNGYTASVRNGSITSRADSGRLTVIGDGSGKAVTVTIDRR